MPALGENGSSRASHQRNAKSYLNNIIRNVIASLDLAVLVLKYPGNKGNANLHKWNLKA